MKQIIFTITLLFTSVAFSQSKQLIKLSDGVERYVEFTPPKAGKPWIVFTNGLVYELSRWEAMDKALRSQGYGIIHYYFRGQDLTLKREVEVYKTPSFLRDGLAPQDFVQELKEILQQLQVKDKIVLVGLSYGSHVAANFAQTYPQMIRQLIFMAPLVVPLERYQPQGAWMDWNLAWVKALWGDRYYDYAYQQIYQTYLNQLVTQDRVPLSLSRMPNEYRASLYQLVRAVRDFDLKNYSLKALPINSVSFLLAHEEVPAAFLDQVSAFDHLDRNSQGCLVWLTESQHAIPDSAPGLGAQVLHHMIVRDPKLIQGKKFKSTSQGLTPW